MMFFPHIALQAILVLDSPDVDVRLWNATVAEMEMSGKLGKRALHTIRMSGPG
jgi:hypothetical protein